MAMTLLQRCQQSFMGKYSLDEAGKTFFQIEVPKTNLGPGYLDKALEAAAVYSDRYDGIEDSAPEGVTHQPPSFEKAASSEDHRDRVDFFSTETLALYFKTIEGWGWNILDRLTTDHWVIAYKGNDRQFKMTLSFNRSWAYFQAPLLNELSGIRSQSEFSKALFGKYLLRLNEQAFWAKFGLDEESQVLLMLDIPLEMFDLKRFRLAARTLETYADNCAYEIQIMSSIRKDERLSGLLSALPNFGRGD